MNILILARMTTAFDGSTVEKQPLGGSESALLYMSRELAALGHRVVIFNNCFSGEGLHHGVEYKHLTSNRQVVEYSKTHSPDIFIAFRDLPALLLPIRSRKKIWWGHDDFSNIWKYPALLYLIGWLASRFADRFFVVSQWMGRILEEKLHITKEKIYITRNGINLRYFEGQPLKRYHHRLAYTSVPERGLDIMLEIFPEIKRCFPGSELHVFCGYDLGILKPEDKDRLSLLYARAEQPGVILRGNKSQIELAQELKQSYLWVYPSHENKYANFFAETSCIAALEAQAAGLPVIAGKRGALPESVIDGKTGLLIDGNPYSSEYKLKFINAVADLLSNPEKWSRMSESAREYIRTNYPWTMIAREWEEELKCLLSQ
jgi:glycosyltransferase involved in cell wall biosynthesis